LNSSREASAAALAGNPRSVGLPRPVGAATSAGSPGRRAGDLGVPPAPRPRPRAPLRADSAKSGFLDDRWILAALFALPLGVCVRGFTYYSAPLSERLRNPLHVWLKPGGPLGLAFGLAGFAMFVFMWLYPLRKKIRWLAWTGKLGSWLRIHILAGLWIPLVVAVHAAWRFEGVIGLGYYAMLIVCLSGVVGRYLYVRIPHSHSGLELSIEEVAAERTMLISRIANALGVDTAEVRKLLALEPPPEDKLSWSQTLVKLFKDDRTRARALKRLRREWCHAGPGRRNVDPHTLRQVLSLARREMALQQQARMLEATRLVFGYWHVAHRPVAVTALVAVMVHVIVAVMIGGVAGSHVN
jgi:hypothetical protein